MAWMSVVNDTRAPACWRPTGPVILITIAWVSVVIATGGTPLLEANRARFVAVYAGLWVSSHFMRPIRLSLAIAAAPTMDKVGPV
eukprot:gene19052-25653_t